MNEVVDAVGQWLTQLSVLGQVTVMLLILLPVGGFVAFLFVGLIDTVFGRVFGKIIVENEMERVTPRKKIVLKEEETN
ncbi:MULTISPECIES: hypothetical protein [unclassified Corynebacterium]|uniref:hypothetical protein n=1 Tax=unclassified Corynebacterium TaxID=2624378 RepID=UPI0030AEDBF3